ncbi:MULTISPECIES: hypothetical protein [unclassified Leifsonia]|uniref:hypothetical protein n=1 Tax=unclassified Leifsonia TaxID=2663824 RepID=UPI0006F49B31|nr:MULTISPECIES: hypothetical protein [unclassified Leifsonia]KQX07641.1 hypothetical protein ASC59_07880 [Leifsonia sp. Root1293]KRA11923.1 hypothetical protein ASD61_07880 [Leifsonia sp. Root60]
MSLSHDDLPFPEYDHVQLGHLPARIAPLTGDQLQQLIDYEEQHGNRLPVLVVLRTRLEALRNGAEPTGTLHTDFAEQQGAPGPTGVGPQTTSAPPVNPPAHGDPTNPAQPR